jgi:hypothetical protein
MKKILRRYSSDMVGLGAYALVVAGLWGRFGWHWGLVALGAPFAAFYFRDELRGGDP